MRLGKNKTRAAVVCLLITMVIAFCVYRIRHNRQQRDAEAELWTMGALTAHGPFPAAFIAPMGELDFSVRYRHKGWLDDLEGFSPPTAVLLSYPEYYAETISDDSVDHLSEVLGRLPSLKVVLLQGTRITDDGIRRLQAKLPHCEVRRDTGPDNVTPSDRHNGSGN